MAARDVFVNLICKNKDYKQKILAKGHVYEETMEHQITTFSPYVKVQVDARGHTNNGRKGL